MTIQRFELNVLSSGVVPYKRVTETTGMEYVQVRLEAGREAILQLHLLPDYLSPPAWPAGIRVSEKGFVWQFNLDRITPYQFLMLDSTGDGVYKVISQIEQEEEEDCYFRMVLYADVGTSVSVAIAWGAG